MALRSYCIILMLGKVLGQYYSKDEPLDIAVKPEEVIAKHGSPVSLHCDVFSRSNRPLSETNIRCKVWWTHWSEPVTSNQHYNLDNTQSHGAQVETSLHIRSMVSSLEGRYTCFAECSDKPGRKFTGDSFVSYSSERYVPPPVYRPDPNNNKETDDGPPLVGIIIGVVAAVILILIITGVIIFCKRNRRIDETVDEQQEKIHQFILEKHMERTNDWVSEAAQLKRTRAYSEDEMSRLSLSSKFSDSHNRYNRPRRKRRVRRGERASDGGSSQSDLDCMTPNRAETGTISSFDMPSVSQQASPVTSPVRGAGRVFNFITAPKEPTSDNAQNERRALRTPPSNSAKDPAECVPLVQPENGGAVAVEAAKLTDEILKLYNANIEEEDEDIDDTDEEEETEAPAGNIPNDQNIPGAPHSSNSIPAGGGVRPKDLRLPALHTPNRTKPKKKKVPTATLR